MKIEFENFSESVLLKELYTASQGMMPQQMRLEVIANNMANSQTPGFKREAVFERDLIEARGNLKNVPGDTEEDDVPVGSYIDFSNGNMYQTDNPLDIAIDEKGFFSVQDEAGNVFFTRSGHYKLSLDGYIVDMEGNYLLGSGGPIALDAEFFSDPNNMKSNEKLGITIHENGEIFVNDHLVGTVSLTDIKNPESMRKVTGKNFIPTDRTHFMELSPDDVRLRQGWLEGSNVNIISEMVSMIELQRMFEAGQRVIRTNEESLSRSIQIGRFM